MIAEAERGFLGRAFSGLNRPGGQDDANLVALRTAVLLAWNRLNEAAETARNGIEIDALSPDVRQFLADAAFDARVTGLARSLCQSIHADSPENLDARLRLAKCHLLTDAPAAAEFLVRPIADDLHSGADAQDVLGQALLAQGRHEQAEVAFRRALELSPGRIDAMVRLGTTLWATGRYDESIATIRAAFELEGAGRARSTAFKELGDDLAFLERDVEAQSIYDAALPTNANADAHRAYSDVLMRMGDLPAAYENYEFRWMLPPLDDLRPQQIAPGWQGQPLAGKRVLLRVEQGIGDNFQYLRYARHLQALGATTMIGRFSDVINGCDGLSEIDPPVGSPVDYYVDMASLPRLFGTKLDQVPNNVPYIMANADKIERWAMRSAAPGRLKVGLVWAGNPAHARDAERSIALKDLSPVLGVRGVTFYSLQKIAANAQEPESRPEHWVDLAREFTDFGDTAAAIANLDIVICVDTSVAHLAGAMASEVWTLLAKPSDPRWMSGTDTVWYPTMKLFRQRERGDWKEVIERVKVALEERVKAGAAAAYVERPFEPREPALPRQWVAGETKWPGHRRGLSAVIDTRLGLVQYLPDEPVIGDAIGWYGEHLQPHLDWLSRLVQPGDVMVEVGAGTGLHTLGLARMVGAQGHLLVYEDDATKRQILGQNMALHKVAWVTPMRRRLGAVAEAQSRAGTEESLEDLQLERLDWLKVNEGGRALEVLQGAEDAAWRLRPKLFLTAQGGEQLGALIARAKDLGYRCWVHEAPLYNPQNFNRREGDIFGGRVATTLFALPEEIDFARAIELDER